LIVISFNAVSVEAAGFARDGYCAVYPPSTAMLWPVRNFALPDARKTIVWAISSDVTARLPGA
jgi:hypothetical protein